ncbi:hypothetical protein ACFYZ4_09330 [Streptomyces sp. NPDC001513]|uniref:hypothetical protein n=1 Tax=Streptomyces sp. NPDC001513 TaxID=3364580 RepID=UPI00367E0BD6
MRTIASHMSLTAEIEEPMTTATNVTRVQDDYAQQIAGDLSANQAAQEQARTELQRLQQEIGQLEEGEKVLLKMQEALGVPLKPTPTQATKPTTKPNAKTGTASGAKPEAKAGAKPGTPSGAKTATPAGATSGAKTATPAGTASGAKPGTPSGAKTATPAGATSGAKPEAKAGAKPGATSGAKAGAKSAAVPAARSAARGAKKAAEPKETTTAKAPRARKTTEGTVTKKETGGPSWLDLVTATIAGQTEPRSAAEVTDALSTAHPERKVQATVIRNTLEQGVARGILERSKQGRSVYYTPTDSPTTPGTSLPQPELP